MSVRFRLQVRVAALEYRKFARMVAMNTTGRKKVYATFTTLCTEMAFDYDMRESDVYLLCTRVASWIR